jgi:S-adenosylmethionine synthetase
VFRSNVERVENDVDGNVILHLSDPTRTAGPYNLVVLCIGFGDEYEFEGSAARSYWVGDNIDEARILEHEKYFVSGAGDGGLIETLRLVHRDFNRGKMAVDLARHLDGGPIAKRIEYAEREARLHTASSLPKSLTEIYLSCANDIPAEYQQPLLASFCNSGRVHLIVTNKDPFGLGAAPIHKLLVAHAVARNVVKLSEGRLERHGSKTCLTKDKKREVLAPDFLVARHGAGKNLTNIISKAGLEFLKRKQESLNDHIVRALWDQEFFNGVQGYEDRNIGNVSFAERLLSRATKAIASIDGLATVEISGAPGKITYVGRTKPNFASGNIPGVPANLFGIPLSIESSRRMKLLSGPSVSEFGSPDATVEGPPWFVVSNAMISAEHSIVKVGRIGGLFQNSSVIFAVTAAHVIQGDGVDISMIEQSKNLKMKIGTNRDTVGIANRNNAGNENRVSEKLVWFRIADDQLVEATVNGKPQTISEQPAVYQLGKRVHLGSRPLAGRVTAVRASAYLTDGFQEELFHGGIVVVSEDPKRPFAVPGDSGSPVFNEKGETVGLVVAGDDEGTFIAPLGEAVTELNMLPLTRKLALKRNREVLRRRSLKVRQSPVTARSWGGFRGHYLFSSESVSEGHPDKVCDRISDEVVDLFFRESQKGGVDPSAVRVACEVLATTNKVIIAGETRGPESITNDLIEDVARRAIKSIGYEQDGFHWRAADIEILLHSQSPDIARGIDAMQSGSNKEEGAGDQGIMFGYACTETPSLMPAPIYYAHRILRNLANARKSRRSSAAVLGPDAKSQVTVQYENGKPVGVRHIVLSTQHYDPELSSSDVREIVEPFIRKAFPSGWITAGTVWHINPTGRFVIGGPDGDCGLTGRKIIVDTYGAAAPHGGGAFSGKDPTKVDRSAAYAARYLAKNIVAAGLADRCTLQLAYAIGVARPLSMYVDTHGTGRVSEEKLEKAVAESMDLTPRGIRTHLDLNKPIYARTSSYGHFGRTPDKDGGFSWEKTDLADALKRRV